MRILEVDKQLTAGDLNNLEIYVDRIFSKLGIDVEFTKHFLDRVNDARNVNQITSSELVRLFKQEAKRWGRQIASMNVGDEAVMKDLATDINLPFVITQDYEDEELDLIAKTIMRKKDFKTSDREYTVESTDLLWEAKNTHLEHLEDEILNNGLPGVQNIINYFSGLYEMLHGNTNSAVDVTVKWDGAPAVIAGVDPEDGRFFVGTKSVFTKNPKLNKSLDDIMRNHGDMKEEGDRAGLRDKLRVALVELAKLNITGVIQGDIIFTKDMLRSADIDGTPHIVFKPNTITYAVPEGSELATRISTAKIGVIFHTNYTGDSIANMSAGFDVDVSGLNQVPSVFFDDATYKDVSGKMLMTADESSAMVQGINDMKAYMGDLRPETFSVLSTGPIRDLVVQLKAHINQYVRQGSLTDDPSQFVDDFTQRLFNNTETAIQKLKTGREGPAGQRRAETLKSSLEWVEANRQQLSDIYGLYLRVKAIKKLIINKFNTAQSIDSFIEQGDGSFKVTAPEGFVAIDHIGNAVKLVDRLEFSKANFSNTQFG